MRFRTSDRSRDPGTARFPGAHGPDRPGGPIPLHLSTFPLGFGSLPGSDARTHLTLPMSRTPSAPVVPFLLVASLSVFLFGCPTPKDEAPPAPAATSAPAPAPTETARAAVPASEDAAPPVVVDPPIMDFGTVPPGRVPEATVKLRNLSDRPLRILAVQPSCKCTTVDELVGKDIPAKGEVELTASMKKDSSPGQKKADIKVLVEGYDRTIPIQLRMEVSLPVRAVPGYVNAVKGQPTSGRIVVESLDKEPFTICAVGGKPPNLLGFDPATDAPRNQYLLAYDVVNDFAGQEIPLFWVIETDRDECPLVDVRMRLESTMPRPTFKMQDYRITFGRVAHGETADFTVEIGEQPDDEPILGASLESDRGRVEIVDMEKEGIITRLTLRFTPSADSDGLVWAPLKLHSNRRTQDLHLWGQVVPAGHEGCLGR